MSINPSPPLPEKDILLNHENYKVWHRSMIGRFDFYGGRPGRSIAMGIESKMVPLPTALDKDSDGNRIYQPRPNDATQLTAEARADLKEDCRRQQTINDKRRDDDCLCVAEIFNRMTPAIKVVLRNTPAYDIYKKLDDGERSWALFQALKSVASTPDLSSVIQRASAYLSLKYEKNIDHSMDALNASALQFKDDLATADSPNGVTFNKLKFIVAWEISNIPAYQTFRQLYLSNCSPEDLEDPEN
jgi:hypothetical protein